MLEICIDSAAQIAEEKAAEEAYAKKRATKKAAEPGLRGNSNRRNHCNHYKSLHLFTLRTNLDKFREINLLKSCEQITYHSATS